MGFRFQVMLIICYSLFFFLVYIIDSRVFSGVTDEEVREKLGWFRRGDMCFTQWLGMWFQGLEKNLWCYFYVVIYQSFDFVEVV